MGKLRQSVCLLLSLCLLFLGGCGPAPVDSQPTPPPLPLAIASVSQQDSIPEVEVSPTPEVRGALRLSRRPPPVQPAPPSPQSSGRVRFQAPPPTLSPESSYPKAQPPKLSLETSYPKAASAQSEVEKAEAASLALDSFIQSGRLQAAYHGTGDPWRMVHFTVYNSSQRPVRVQLVSGMILNPEDYHPVQPLLVTEDADFVLQPGESYSGSLTSFCMDSRVPAPQPGEPVAYRFSARTRDGGPAAVRAQKAAEKLLRTSPYRHAVTQIAIWRSLNQPVEEKHWISVLGPYANDPRTRQEVLREVERVLKSI